MSLTLRKVACSPPTIVFIATFLFTLFIQLRSPFVFLIDGPYYIAQYRYLRYTGAMHYPDPPLAFMILYPFEHVTDVIFGSPYLGLKVCVSLMTALASAMITSLILKLGGSPVLSIILGLCYGISPFTVRVELDFIKNGIGLAFVVLHVYSLTTPKPKLKYTGLILSAVLTSLTHVLSFAILAAISIPMHIHSLVSRNRLSYMETVIASLGAIGVMSSLIMIFPELVGGDTRKLFSFINSVLGTKSVASATTLSAGELRLHHFIIPYMVLPSYLVLAYLVSVPAIVAGVAFRKQRFSSIAFASGLILTLISTPMYPSNYYVRFILMASLLIPLSLVWLINYRGKLPMLIGFFLLAILIVSAVLTANASTKVTLRPGEYRELETALNTYIPEGATILVARPMLRYWVEAISAPKYEVMSPKNFERPSPHYIVGELGRDPIPPFGRVIFRGNFIWIVKVP